jgi:hypothetical protein
VEPKPVSERARKPIVDIGVACNINQSFQWWSTVMLMLLSEERKGNVQIGQIRTVGSAVPDHNKNNIIGDSKRRMRLTDYNRQEIAKGFLSGEADWIFWMDDDTAPPPFAITGLLHSGHDFAAGAYFMTAEPYHPIAYKKMPDSGLYAPVYNYPDGALMEVDSVGFGCTLVHRSVYEKIRDGHSVFERHNGALLVLPNDKVSGDTDDNAFPPYMKDGIYYEHVKAKTEDDDRPFPFYQLEHGRTEDHYFCELAANVGVKPWLDTSVICTHYKIQPTTKDDYLNTLYREQGLT